MSYQLIIKEPVREEIAEAFLYYESQQHKLGYKLFDAIQNSLQHIESRPLAYQIKYGLYRTILVKPFPYILIYEVINKQVVVYQFFNCKQNITKRHKK